MLIKIKKSERVLVPKDVCKILKGVLRVEDKLDREKEHFWVFGLTPRNAIKYLDLISMGTVNSNLVHPRETFRRAVIEGVSQILVAHNHPSDEIEPSEADLLITSKLKKAGEILGVDVIDHVVIGESGYFSFKENGLLSKEVK